MYIVEIKSKHEQAVMRSSDPSRTIDNLTRTWLERGMAVQWPLPDADPAVYQAYKNGRKVITVTVRKEQEHE